MPALKTSFFRNIKDSYAGSRFATSKMGAAVKRGVAENFGFQYKKGVSEGFLGLKASRGLSFGARAMAGIGGAINLGFMASSVYSGYQEGGVLGAAKELGTTAAIQVGLNVAGVAVNALWPVALVAGSGALAYKVAENSRQYGRNLRNISMGTPPIDVFGTMSTVRQRSLAALQNTHINGRMALGNEGLLSHNNIYSRR